MRISFLLISLASWGAAAPTSAQTPPQPTQTVPMGNAPMDTTGLAAGSYRIPGTAPNPLAAPSSTPNATMPPRSTQINVTPAQALPPPIHDDKTYSFTLIDLLEFRPKGSNSDVRWDIEGWRGTDYRRFYFKSEGEKSTTSSDYDADLQLLSGRHVKPFTVLQYGLRLQGKGTSRKQIARPMAVVAIEARVPYNYEIETSLYMDPHGHLSGSFTGAKDVLLSQRLILQGRLEAAAALQDVERFGVGSGLNTVDVGLRLRYEIRREFAPYLGVTYGKSYGRTATLIRRGGGDAGQVRFVAGVRAWF